MTDKPDVQVEADDARFCGKCHAILTLDNLCSNCEKSPKDCDCEDLTNVSSEDDSSDDE